ncbi:MAG: thiosulfate oxidation carrier protein SoxY [Gammaproteobacteria bacterium]|nr:thiosulfate oxidation carrier protein SoxY [Gammaproteobacteria bacterium]
MNITRRHALKVGSLGALIGSISSFTKMVFAEWPAAAFDTTAYEDSYAAVIDGVEPEEGKVKIEAPEIASNGATVPITISTDLDNVKSISVLVEKNPRPYIATFFINENIEATISTRVKMRETSNVVAIVETTSGKFIAKQSVKVTAGGCA